jgi:hypothetical protein
VGEERFACADSGLGKVSTTFVGVYFDVNVRRA